MLGTGHIGSLGRSGVRGANIGPPIHAWSISDISEPDFYAKSYAVLRPHVESLRRNRSLRAIQFQQALLWETGKPPTYNGETMLVSPQHNIIDTLRDMAPHACRLLMELQVRKKYRDLPVMLEFFDLMRRWGADPDPTGVLRMVAGCTAGGPELTTEDAIRIRSVCQPGTALDLNGLVVSDEALAAIPNTVTALALVGSPVTDAGIANLLRLTSLKRLNIAGTQITDDGLAALEALQSLEWICMDGTRITSVGVDRLRRSRPSLELATPNLTAGSRT